MEETLVISPKLVGYAIKGRRVGAATQGVILEVLDGVDVLDADVCRLDVRLDYVAQPIRELCICPAQIYLVDVLAVVRIPQFKL
jgi:hypothetical protein